MSETPTTEAAEGSAADAETPADAPDGDNQPDALDTTETSAVDDSGDTFPREVVEKLRKESASYRDRAKTAEDRLSAMQRQSVDRQITTAGLKPAAVWAVTQLENLLADDGTVDAAKVSQAMATARQTLGITQRRAPFAGQGELNSGATGPKEYTPKPGFAAAFGPREK